MGVATWAAHRNNGFFVFRPGQGWEYTVSIAVVAFAIGTGFEFSTYGVVPATWLFASLVIGLFRAGYEHGTAAIMRRAGVRRHVLLVGEGDELDRLRRVLGSSRSSIDYELVGALSPSRGSGSVVVMFATGTVVSIVKTKSFEIGLTLPAGSVAVAVIV